MRLLILTLAGLIACGDDTTADSASGSTTVDDSGTTSGTDTADTVNANLDDDHDGFKAAEDCDDHDAQIYPGATETCDEQDNDCDDLIDEGFDGDSDGFLSAELCEHGDDCDDGAVLVYPGATETPYDGIDQDCDGADLTDVDGDGHDAEAAGGDDCDDDDAALNPGAEDVPKDGIDQDCSGEDNLDGDGDGYGDRDLGGDDCDDEDPTVNPGALDWADDDINSDCTSSTSGRHSLESWGMTVVGVPGYQSLVGYASTICDLDEDGLADVVMADPFGGSYTGQVSVFLGASWSTWTPDMHMTDGDTVIDGGGGYDFFAAGVVCADVDGDGHLDLVVANSEADIPASGIDQDYGLYFFYGDGSPFDTKLTRDDADAAFTVDLAPVDTSQSTVYLNHLRAADLDGNGAADLLVFAGSEDLAIWDGEARLLVIEGNRYSGYGDLEDEAIAALTMSDVDYINALTALPDLDGDGSESYMLAQAEHSVAPEDTGPTPDTGGGVVGGGDTGDTGDTGEPPWDYGEWLDWEGRVQLMDVLPTSDGDFADHVSLTGHGAPARFFGLEAASGDFDADGLLDLVVSSYGDPDWALELPGAVSLFSDIATASGSGSFDLDADADGLLLGDEDEGYLGWGLANGGDADGDGSDDLWVLEVNGGSNDEGWLYLVGGEYLTGDLSIEDADMLSFYAPNPDDGLGYGLSSSGDVDGDGIQDVVIGSPFYTTSSSGEGRAFILLSSDW